MASKKEQNAKGHFTGQGECKIHTSRSHAKCKPIAAKGGGCHHQKNCATPPVTWKPKADWKWGNEWESHHIVCIECVNGYRGLDALENEVDRIAAVYRLTEWCINQKENLIALPMKVVYAQYPGARSLNLPCHNWDHNIEGGYFDEVTEQMNLRVWQKIKEAAADTKPCDLSETVVKKELENLSTAFRSVLKRRGARSAGAGHGTLAAWRESQKERVEDQAPNWWFPFSMAKDSVAADRPATKFGEPDWSRSAKKRLQERRAKAA